MKKTAITLASGLAASLLLASCSTPPGLPKTLPDTRASLPDTWNAPEVKGGAFSARSDWWNEFSDPTLSSLIETGLGRSHHVRAALARLEEARAYAEETGAALYPNISLGADASNSRTESATSGAYQKSKIHRVQGEAAWEIDFWGKNRKAREAALASADSSLWAVRAVELSLAGNIARQYFGWVAARQSLAISENTLASLAKTLSITEAKYRLGTATEVDVNTARSDVETQRTAVSSWKLAAEQHLHALALLTAQPELKLPDSPYGLPEVPAIRPGIPSTLLQNRPDVREAEAMLRSAHASVAVAYAAFFPSISLTGSAGTQSRALSDLFTHSIWSVGLSLDLPIFDFGRRSARFSQAKAAETAALESYRMAAEQAYSDVRDSLSAATYYSEEARSRTVARSTAEKAAAQASTLYEAGKGGFLSLLTAQRSANAAALSEISTQLNGLNNAVALNLALGAGPGNR